MVNTADSAAMARSQAITRLKPAPAAVPLTAQITGALPRPKRERPRCRSPVICISSLRAPSPALAKAPKSPPAQNIFPAPVSTMARTAGSDSASMAAARNSLAVSGPMALAASGRLMVMVATLSATS